MMWPVWSPGGLDLIDQLFAQYERALSIDTNFYVKIYLRVSAFSSLVLFVALEHGGLDNCSHEFGDKNEILIMRVSI